MAVVLAAIVSCEEDTDSGDLEMEHCCAKNVAGWVGGDANGGDGMSCMIVDGFYSGKGREVIALCVELGVGFRGGGCVARK